VLCEFKVFLSSFQRIVHEYWYSNNTKTKNEERRIIITFPRNLKIQKKDAVLRKLNNLGNKF